MGVSALCEWVAFYKPLNAPSGSVSLGECVANVVRLAFPSELDPTTHTWDSILTVLNRHATELNLLQPLRSELLHEHYQGAWVSGLHGGPPPAAELELERTLSALCIGAFKGAQQASFINDVLSFSEHIQLTLFTLLRDDEDSEPATHSDRTVTTLATTTTEHHHHDTPPPSTPVQSTRHTPTTSATTPASSLSCSKNETKRMARENHILKDENAELQRELVQVKAAMATLHDEEESRKDAFENLKLELRVEAAKNERTIKKQVDEYVAHLQAELSSATAKLASLSGIEKELEAARDELDILKPAADKAIKLEARMEKYQAKLDDMTRIKEANRRLEQKAAELTEKTHAQDAQLQKLLTVQRKLDESKEALANMAVRCRELDVLASRRQLERNAAVAELDSVRLELSTQVQAKQDLVVLMQQQQLQEDAAASSPGTVEEHLVDTDMEDVLDQLRRENAKLKSQLSVESATRVDALGDELDTMARVKKSFETKYFDSQRVVEQLEADLDALRTQHHATLSLLDASVAKCDAVQDDMQKQTLEWTQEQAAWRTAEAALNADLRDAQITIEDHVRGIEALDRDKAELAALLATQTEATAAAEAVRDELNEELLNLTVNLADAMSKLEEHEQRAVKVGSELETTKELWMAESNEFNAFKMHAHEVATALDDVAAKYDDAVQDVTRLRHQLDLNESQRSILEHVISDNDLDLAGLRARTGALEAELQRTTEAWGMAMEETAMWRAVAADGARQGAAERTAHAAAHVAWRADLQDAKNEIETQMRVAQDIHDALDAKVRALEADAVGIKDRHDRRVAELETAQRSLVDKLEQMAVREQRGEQLVAALKTKYLDDMQAKDDAMQLVEVQASRLEAKNRMLLDKEHHDASKRHVSAEYEAVSLKMEMQMNALKRELDALGKEHKALQTVYISLKSSTKYTFIYM
ncbi:hypothetical protein, variant 2 [Aphanomyces astaci]|uniref:Hook C-terminal domain-containing protein n=1 Tax=Aphanomyces astaci TaxID=112090 RepID=W4GFF3_APHAT|nr:hypothetical protein, variant 2 [Aphanomyces astaci]ETV78422.1 hypothetical protein, variant 2 [Aphanomyces astaci]|eukprot:XP_009832001.1 hypothetical protein, variant 2 [Aphanomyces astaci]